MEYLKNIARTVVMIVLWTMLIGVTSVAASESTSTDETLSETMISQQSIRIQGTVVDAKTEEPIIGANVIIKGTTTGTSTDYDGNFSFEAPEGAILIVSYIGYLNLEVEATSSPMTIRIQEDTKTLEEVVVVGYSVQKKESLTGSLQTLKSDKLMNVTTPAVENALNGKAPGVYVSPGTGRPGEAGKIVIRGKSTVNGSTDPLWVIDGVIVGSSPGALNSADIESMTILKDAASTAIYGSQGANGVIVVTTKNARPDKITINLSAKAGVTRLNRGNLQMMDGEELYDYYNSFSNKDKIKFARWNEDLRNDNFDWWDLATQTGVAQDYNLSVSGGNEMLKSYMSVGYYDETGAVKGYDYKRYSFRYKSDYKPFDWLTLKPSVSGSRRDIENKEYDITSMYSKFPWDSPYDKEGNLIPHRSKEWVNSNVTNYLYDLQWNYSESTMYEFMGNLDFDIRVTDWLTFSSVNNFRWQGYNYMAYQDPRSNAAIGVGGRVVETNTNMQRRYTNQMFRFNKGFGKHLVNGLVAYEFNDYKYKQVESKGTGLSSGFTAMDTAVRPEAVAGNTQTWAVKSYLLNANYSYDYKYLAQLSLRRDGASNFGDNAKYGNFFSISGGWNINREDFFRAEWVDVLKLRLAYGSVGNRPRSLYPQYDLYSLSKSYSYDASSGALISQKGNQDLTWEKTYTLGVGVDFNFLDRFRMTLDYYNKNTSNLLYAVPVSGLTGVTSIWQNVGEVRNNGMEVTLGADIIRNKDWYWSVDFNIGMNRNKVKELYGENPQIIVGPGVTLSGAGNKILKPGLDADTWYLAEWAGVNSENGAPMWYKTVTDDKGNITRETTSKYAETDQVACGAYTPDFYGGFSTDLSWKNFDLNAVFGYSVGGKIYNYSCTEYDSDGTYTDRNQMKLHKGWSRWENPGDQATHPVASYNNSSNASKASSRFLEKGDYLKLRSLTLGYNFSLPQFRISNLRVFATGENLFTITPFSGLDPEIAPTVGSDGNYTISGVVGPGVYPSAKKFMFGINLTL